MKISQHEYLRLGFYRSAADAALSEIAAAWAAALLLAIAAYAVALWIAPAAAALFSRLPSPLRRYAPAAAVLLAAARLAWSVERTDYYRRFERVTAPPALAAAAIAVAAAFLLAARAVSRRPWPARRTLLAIAAMALVAFGLRGAIAASFPRALAGRPNVILVSLDTVRADHVGCYGYARPTTPILDALARESTLFELAVAPAPWTLPSHASMFTSLYPHEHGAAGPSSTLAAERVTIAETLREAGYSTAAFTGGGYLSSKFGLSQGFDVFENLYDSPTSAIVSRALAWFDGRPADQPYFLFVHTYEPHTPYTSATFASLPDAGRVGPSFAEEDLRELRSGQFRPTPAEQRYIEDLYDGDIHAADAALGPLWDRLRAAGELDRSLVIVTSDHGEELFERSARTSAGHGHSLYEELLRVPLVIRYAKGFPAGMRVATPVSLIDLVPTLAAVTGVPWPEPRAALSAGTERCDLAMLVAGGHCGNRHGVLSEAMRWGKASRSFRTARYMYIRPVGAGASPAELY
ncbi:MAG TPA: sulfatase, partial [Verrucomicrobiae bacterium]|nr:sulfatase [Verrucomicrobiae bacterium]